MWSSVIYTLGEDGETRRMVLRDSPGGISGLEGQGAPETVVLPSCGVVAHFWLFRVTLPYQSD